MHSLRDHDPLVYEAMLAELKRQQETLELIPSENIVSKQVLEAQGSVLTNKYAEGYPGKRYYGGCQFVDKIEEVCIQRAKMLFGADHANVQPHSGSSANMAVYLSVLKPGDKILGMDLSHGGHLTHGAKVSFSGSIFQAFHYGVNKETFRIDYDQVRDLAKQHQPRMIIAGASSYPRQIDFKIFSDIAKEVGAYFLVDMAHIAGLVAAKIHQNPVPYADFVTTTTHKTLRGPRGGIILCREEHKQKINSKIFPGIQGGPLMHVIAGKAVALKEAMTEEFQEYQRRVVKNAKALAQVLVENGFNLVTDGTDNHLMLVDLRNKSITGKEAEEKLDLVGITLNKNTVPFETQSPFVTSGIRLGTPVITSRGMGEFEMRWIAHTINRAFSVSTPEALGAVREEVRALCRKFPIYQW